MPRRPRKNAKNTRRVVAAERALAAIPQPRKPSRKPGKTGRSKGRKNSSSDADRYARSVLSDELHTGLTLPTNGYTGPYAKFRVSGRSSLNLANTAPSLHAAIVCNPYLMWTDSFFIEHLLAGVDSTATIPTCYQHLTASNSQGLPTGFNAAAITLPGALQNLVSSAYAGRVRCHGVKFTITYTGTELNKGGVIIPFHNPNHSALACQNEFGAASDWPGTAFDTASEITAVSESFGYFRINDSFSFVWRPRNIDFQDVTTYFPYESPVAAGLSSSNPAAYEYLPPTVSSAPANKGWVTGFELRPAAGTAASVSNYVVDIEAEYDLQINRSGPTGTSLPVFPSTHAAVADPVATAKVQNALGALHHARSTQQHPVTARSMGVSSLSAIGSTIKTAAVDVLASRLASAFA